ncbi:MAG: hypothetical protein ACK4JA_09875 [Parazoarcus communis]
MVFHLRARVPDGSAGALEQGGRLGHRDPGEAKPDNVAESGERCQTRQWMEDGYAEIRLRPMRPPVLCASKPAQFANIGHPIRFLPNMLLVISPAKALDYETPPTVSTYSQPDFLDQSAALIDILRERTTGGFVPTRPSATSSWPSASGCRLQR